MRHRRVAPLWMTDGNALRAAVLGANDGLVSNLSLVMGVAGAAFSERAVLIAGLAGLLAGASSMALGEWLSVQSARELYGRQIEAQSEELAGDPERKREELAAICRRRGLSPEQAWEAAGQMLADREGAVETLARERLGIDPQELGGSAWVAAGASFVLFSLGAVVPVAPFALLQGPGAVTASLVASATALFLVGAGITIVTGRSLLLSGGRQVGVGLAAAALTYTLGRLLGVAVGG